MPYSKDPNRFPAFYFELSSYLRKLRKVDIELDTHAQAMSKRVEFYAFVKALRSSPRLDHKELASHLAPFICRVNGSTLTYLERDLTEPNQRLRKGFDEFKKKLKEAEAIADTHPRGPENPAGMVPIDPDLKEILPKPKETKIPASLFDNNKPLLYPKEDDHE